MAVFRIEKTKDFTIMSNHHLRDKSLSLKAKGLHSLLLSLPEIWNYSVKGLSHICKEGVDSIGAALQELEKHGYLTRRQIRDESGKFKDLEYTIHEIPVEPVDNSVDNPVDNSEPESGEPDKDSPQPENPGTAEPDSGNAAQIITNDKVFNINITDLSKINPSIRRDAPKTADRTDETEVYREILKENIEYDYLCDKYKHSRDEIEELFELMLETVCTTKKTIRVDSEDKPAEVVKSRMLKLDQFHIEYVLERLNENTTGVRNIKSYLLTVLYNAPVTIGNHYKQMVQHDFYGK